MVSINRYFTEKDDKAPKLVSIVFPVYNEMECLPKIVPALCEYLAVSHSRFNWELIFIDDCSSDNSFDYLKEAALTTPANIRLSVFQLAKNSGSHIAITAGLNISRADFTILMASDGQDPLDVIDQFIFFWEKGAKLILAARKDNLQQSFLGKWFSSTAWTIMNWATKIDMPQGGCDMVGIDKTPLIAFNKMDERNTTFIYRLLSMGFNPTVFQYVKRERIGGKSSWTFIKKISIMLDAITGYSSRPLRLITKLSLLLVVILAFRWAIVIIKIFSAGTEPSDRTVIVNSIFTSLAIVLLVLSAIGDYIWRILDETRKRPSYEFNKIAGRIFDNL